MADLTWLETTFVIFLLVCVFVGTLPVINTGSEVPVAAAARGKRNHYAKASLHHPRVAVLIPA